jgi:hypothetical protein
MSQAYAAVYYTSDAEWPYDIGDDPSFRAARGNANAVTWGVCRRDLRNVIRPGDVVLFFATLPRNISAGKQIPYWFVGYATVAEKVKQTNVFLERRLTKFKSYQNLLINKVGRTTFEHHETAPGQRHDDWLYRLTCGRTPKKEPFVQAGSAGRFREGPTELSSPVPTVDVAPNYVIFCTDSPSTLVLRCPPRVATLASASRAR